MGLTLSDLQMVASLASTPTPMAGSPATETYNAAGNTDYSRRLVDLASVPTPSQRDYKDGPNTALIGTNPDGSARNRLDLLPRQVLLAGSGPTQTGGGAGTKSTGQLNPAYSRWLMGYPTEWDDCAAMVTRLSLRSQRKSSKRGGSVVHD